jgi:hypothetical protein
LHVWRRSNYPRPVSIPIRTLRILRHACIRRPIIPAVIAGGRSTSRGGTRRRRVGWRRTRRWRLLRRRPMLVRHGTRRHHERRAEPQHTQPLTELASQFHHSYICVFGFKSC